MTLLRQNVLFIPKFKEVSSSIHPYTSALLSFFEIDLMFTPRSPFYLLFFRRVYLKNTLSIIYSFTFDTINSHFQFSIVSDFVKNRWVFQFCGHYVIQKANCVGRVKVFRRWWSILIISGRFNVHFVPQNNGKAGYNVGDKLNSNPGENIPEIRQKPMVTSKIIYVVWVNECILLLQ